MQEKLIILTVQPDCSVTVEPQGYDGKGCKKDTEALEELLGTVTNRELKTEYFTEETTQQAQQYE